MKKFTNDDLEQTVEIQKFGESKDVDPNTVPKQDPTENKGDQDMGKKSKKKQKSPHRRARILASILGFISLVGIAGVIVVSIFTVSAIQKAPEVTVNLLEQGESTQILAADNSIIYDTGAKIAENITYDDIPQSLVDAFLSIEDSRFFEHNGFDLARFSIAMLNNVKDSVASMRLSFDGGGASTLDMQLIRNSVFMSENIATGETEMPATSGMAGIERKLQEIYLATSINRNHILSKKSIFQMYVNRINFGTGNNIIGVQKSAEYYFGKSVQELSLVESAFLAGVINSPSNYTPYASLTNAKERTNRVLYYMNYHGYISDDEYKRALTVPIENLFIDKTKNQQTFDFQSYIDVVLNEASELTGLNPTTTPMIIYTAMNVDLQQKMDAVQRREVSYLNYDSDSYLNMASTIVNNSTGEVVAIMGGYDYTGQRVLNLAADEKYQPGSTIKPLVDYAPTFEYLGWATSHVMTDEPYTIPGTQSDVNNWDLNFEGQVTLRKAISDSRNIPAIQAFTAVQDTIGQAKYIEYLRSLGFKKFVTEDFDFQFSYGSHNFFTNPYELAGAYASVFNGGVFNSPHTIRQVDFKDGSESIKSTHTTTQVLSDAAAYMTAQTMRYVVEDNLTYTARPTRRSYPVYGKTGTTNYDSQDAINLKVPDGSSKDLWVVSATDQYTFATWSGFPPQNRVAENKPYLASGELTYNLPGNMNSYILDALAELYGPGQAIERPSSVADITHIIGTFPYQSPIDGMDSSLITTGLIKRDRLSLVGATPPTLDSLPSANLSVSSSGGNTKLTTTLAQYPDISKLTVAEKTYEMVSSTTGRKYSGTRLYDPSWIYGAVRYGADVVVNGDIVQTKISDSNIIDLSIPSSTTGTVQVCSYYTFDKNNTKQSNRICNNVDASQMTVTVPNFTNLNSLLSFTDSYNVGLDVLYEANNSVTNYGTIKSLSPNLQGQSVSTNSISGKTWSVTLNDFIVDASRYVNGSASSFIATFGNYININQEGSGPTIVGIFSENGAQLDSFKLSDFEGRSITIKVQ